MRMYINI